MAGPWLFPISDTSGRLFARDDNPPLPATVETFKSLIETGEITQDRLWETIQNGGNVRVGDQMFIYGGKKEGIIGCATIVDKIRSNIKGRYYLVPEFNLPLSRALINHPIRGEIVIDEWRIVPRPRVRNLERFESKLRALLPEPFARREPIEAKDRSFAEIRRLALSNLLDFGNIPTGDIKVNARRRKGQAVIRRLVRGEYANTCAVCDCRDKSLLIASHILPWGKYSQHRGNLANVICLCRMHDALFERGYWGLTSDLGIVKTARPKSEFVRGLLEQMTVFRRPRSFPPSAEFVAMHLANWKLGNNPRP